jgi:glycine hydroxymethyltransferase
MTALAHRNWVPADCETFIKAFADETSRLETTGVLAAIDHAIALNRATHEGDCVNLNPATNVMNPRAERALAAGLGSRASLGYPGGKYEMGLEGVERVEVIAAELFGARYAEIRVPSGAIANLYAFMAGTKPGDRIITPPPSIGGHVTHHLGGCAGGYGLDIHFAQVLAAD